MGVADIGAGRLSLIQKKKNQAVRCISLLGSQCTDLDLAKKLFHVALSPAYDHQPFTFVEPDHPIHEEKV